MTVTNDLGVTAADIYRWRDDPLTVAETQLRWVERVYDAALFGRGDTPLNEARAALLNIERHVAELQAARIVRPLRDGEHARVTPGYELHEVRVGDADATPRQFPRYSTLIAEFTLPESAQHLAALINGEA